MSERFRQIEETFLAVLDRPAGERASAVRELCREDPALEREVESLLAASLAAGDFLATPAEPSWIGRRVGAYLLESELGRGGMGTVYRARRADAAYEQTVAVKLFPYGTARPDLVWRFEAERQILAALEHPGIARLLDGGTTEEGLPYLVLEWIDGLPIDRHCDEHRLGVDRRLDLFLEVCEAVASAHRHLVVHRDLKPANILVAPDGRPRLLDFGIAKLLAGARLPVTCRPTETGQRLMTPEYASPEQIEGGTVTTASDVYSLGVLLYVLLAGRLPYRVPEGRRGALEEAILTGEPEPLYRAVPRERALSRRLAGDLDGIVRMALHKDPQRRYPTVEALAGDLCRQRAGLPVTACRATPVYRLRKFVARHRRGVALAVVLALVLAAQTARLVEQHRALERERDTAVKVSQLMVDLLLVTDARRERGEDVTLRELLDRGSARILADLGGEPEVQAALAHDFGVLYNGLGLGGSAKPLLEHALALRRQRLGPLHPATRESVRSLGDAYLALHQWQLAEQTYRRSFAEGDDELARAGQLNQLAVAWLSQARPGTAEPALRQALAVFRRRLGPGSPEEMMLLSNLGVAAVSQGDLEGAATNYREALGIARRQGPAPAAVAQLLGSLGDVQFLQGDYEAAEASLRAALDQAEKILGAEHLQVATAKDHLATVLLTRGRLDEAERLARQALSVRRKLLGAESDVVGQSLLNLGKIEQERGDLPEARRHFEEASELERRILGAAHPQTAGTRLSLAEVLIEQGEGQAAEPLIQASASTLRQALGAGHPGVGTAFVLLGRIRLAAGEPRAAEALLRQGLAVLREGASRRSWRTAAAESELGLCLARQGREREARPLLDAAHARLVRTRGPAARAIRRAAAHLAELSRPPRRP